MNALERRTIGSSLQLGLMTLAGEFDSHMCCGILMKYREPIADWAVTRIDVYDRGVVLVQGLNLNNAPGEYGHRFTWRFDNGKEFSNWRYRFELCPQAEGPT